VGHFVGVFRGVCGGEGCSGNGVAQDVNLSRSRVKRSIGVLCGRGRAKNRILHQDGRVAGKRGEAEEVGAWNIPPDLGEGGRRKAEGECSRERVRGGTKVC